MSTGLTGHDAGPTDQINWNTQVTDQAAIAPRLTGIEGLLQGVEHEVGPHRIADSPARDAPGIHIDDEGHLQPALPSRDIREVADPQLVGPLCSKLPVDPVIGHGTFASPTVVRTTFPRITPRRPSLRINRSTVQRATVTPSRASCRHTLSAP